MIFDLYEPFKGKDGKIKPGIRPIPTEWGDIKKVMDRQDVIDNIAKFRNGDKEAKTHLPAVCYVGRCSGTRLAERMTPTQLVMIDIDHCEDARKAWESIKAEFGDELVDIVILAHVTCSGKGLRIVFIARPGTKTIKDNFDWFDERFKPNQYGDFDVRTYDFSRISFLVPTSEILFENVLLILNTDVTIDGTLKNTASSTAASSDKAEQTEIFDESTYFSEEEKAKFDAVEYRGTPVKMIIEKYVEVMGKPSAGEIHNYYNELVKYFRCITSNDKRLLLYLLPRFGHSLQECADQIKSICRVNTLSSLPKPFYFFLKDNGFYQPREGQTANRGQLQEYMLNAGFENTEMPAYVPPVIREFVRTAPPDFVSSVINALLPMMGTLSSYVGAVYPYDNRIHTTSFFSVIYAPPGTGKGFVERFFDILFEDIKLRDFIQSERENVYLRAVNKKGSNEKSPDLPHTSLRIIPAKNSEAEFLEKQRDNHGYHMFTYAAEMDSWAKGVKAAGGNKDDMIRIAWDNGEYGQAFKSANTFKGMVQLYWNVLITGTIQQVESYFKNVENGLVTRCGFSSIENQEFAEAPKWKPLSSKAANVIKSYVKRCDENTYEEPCNIDPLDLMMINDEDFDKKVNWRFNFKPRQIVDCNWIMPVIDAFHKEQIELAVLDVDRARDVFRRRVGVRGFRLALLCMTLWQNPRKSDLEKCKIFIDWWMHQDIKNMLAMWGAKYNELSDTAPKLNQRSVYAELPDTFTKVDVYNTCIKQGIKTPVRRIIFDWKKYKVIEQVEKNTFKKKKQ